MADKIIKFYYSSVASNSTLRHQQQQIDDVLSSKKINFTKIDIAAPENEEMKKDMWEKAAREDGKKPLPPQLFCDDDYLGDYEAFSEALENDELDVFLTLATKTEKSEASVQLSDGKDD